MIQNKPWVHGIHYHGNSYPNGKTWTTTFKYHLYALLFHVFRFFCIKNQSRLFCNIFFLVPSLIHTTGCRIWITFGWLYKCLVFLQILMSAQWGIHVEMVLALMWWEALSATVRKVLSQGPWWHAKVNLFIHLLESESFVSFHNTAEFYAATFKCESDCFLNLWYRYKWMCTEPFALCVPLHQYVWRIWVLLSVWIHTPTWWENVSGWDINTNLGSYGVTTDPCVQCFAVLNLNIILNVRFEAVFELPSLLL